MAYLHAQAVTSHLEELPCPKDQKKRMIDILLKSTGEKAPDKTEGP